jgi:hypothetical protein
MEVAEALKFDFQSLPKQFQSLLKVFKEPLASLSYSLSQNPAADRPIQFYAALDRHSSSELVRP